jgi:pimeloyl-ACP methyl ester carboxylesterase
MTDTATPQVRDIKVPLKVHLGEHHLFARAWHAPIPAQKAPIVLLHDSLGSVELWRDFPEALCRATGRDVIAYDRLGFGKSDAYPGPIKLDFIIKESTDYLPAVLKALNIDTFVIFGHSVGGEMSAIAATEFPARCVALITESAQAFAEDVTLDGVRRAKVAFADPAQIDRLKRYHGEKAAWVVNSWIDSWLSPELADWTLDPWLPKLKSPVLAIHGDSDEYGSRKHPDMIVGRAGGPAQLALISGCGHVPHREKQAEILGFVRDFLTPIP